MMRSKPATADTGERGAVTTIVAVLVSVGVLFGFLTIAVDYGQLMFERAQVQNGADASALSLARSCFTSPTTCAPGVNNLSALNNANSNDNANGFNPQSGITNIGQCGGKVNVSPSGSAIIAGLPNCPTPTGALADCSPIPSQWTAAAYTGLPYVEVRTKSAAPGGGTLHNWTGGMIGQPSSSAGACARAAKAAAGGAGVGDIPIGISACEWRRSVTGAADGGGGATVYVAPPNYTTYPGTVRRGSRDYPTGYGTSGAPTWPPGAAAAPTVTPGSENVLLIQNPPGGHTPPSPCPAWEGHSLPGGFGILKTVSTDNCKIDIQPDNWVQTDPGSSMACDMTRFVGKVVTVPVYDCTSTANPGVDTPLPADCTTGNGSNAWYHIVTKAKFYLSGYGITTAAGIPNSVNSINPNNTLPSNANPCGSSESCVSGWFTTGYGPGTPVPPSEDFGMWTVTPIG